jgi:hypothetical protein
MKKLILMLALLPVMLHAQAVRYAGNVYTINSSSPQPGGLYPVLASTSATVQICTYSTSQTCPSLATTYTNAAQSASCPVTAQLTPSNSGACTAAVDSTGNFGAWLLAGNYQYMVNTSYGTFGPYDFSVGGGGSSGGVTSLNTLNGALNIVAGMGLQVSTSGSTITISTATAFGINSFAGCGGSLELGASVTNPTCSATYTTTPSTAVITNTDGVDSPLVLTTPFTSGTIAGTFTHSAVHTTTVTLTANTTYTATQTYTWNPRIFGGVGACGATSTVTATGTSALLSTSDVIPTAGLGAEQVGQIIGNYSPAGQCVYALGTNAADTFVDNNTGFPFAFNAPTTVSFTNANGVVVTMYLYQSTNALTGSFQPKVSAQ